MPLCVEFVSIEEEKIYGLSYKLEQSCSKNVRGEDLNHCLHLPSTNNYE